VTDGRSSSDGASPSEPCGLLLVGWIVGAHGIRGRLKVKLADPRSSSLRAGIRLRLGEGGPARVVAEASEPDGHGLLRVALEGLRTREAAEPLRGTGLWVEREQLPVLAEDEYYLADTIGAEVHDEDGRALGRVLGITSNGAQDLLEVAWRDVGGGLHEWLLPALPGFVLAVGSGRVLARVPEEFLPEALVGGESSSAISSTSSTSSTSGARDDDGDAETSSTLDPAPSD